MFFAKKQEASGLFIKLRIKTPLGKIPLISDILIKKNAKVF